MNDADKALGRLKRPINEMPHDVALILKERRLSEYYQARPAYLLVDGYRVARK